MTPALLIVLGALAAAPLPDTAEPYLVSSETMKAQVVGRDKVTWLTGSVEIIHGSIILRGDTAWVSTEQERALVWGNVQILDRNTVVRGRRASYLKRTGRAAISGRPTVTEPDWSLTADSIIYYKNEAKSFSFHDVVMTDSTGRNRVLGDRTEYWHAEGYGIVTGSPRLEMRNRGDSARQRVITAERMEVYRGGAVAVASGDVHYAEDSLWASCGRMSYLRQEGRLTLEQQPRVWQAGAELRAAGIELFVSGDTLRSARARDSVALRQYAEARPDTDVILCDSLWSSFQNGRLDRGRAMGRAWSRYHQDEDGKTSGSNLAAGDEMDFFFTEGRITRLLIPSRARGSYRAPGKL